MLLAHLPNRSPFDCNRAADDAPLHTPRLPFTLICRDADNEDSRLLFHRYAYLEDCIHDLRLALQDIYADADEHPSYYPDIVNDVALVLEIHAHGERRLTLTATGFDLDSSGPWSQVWPFLADLFVLRQPDSDPSPSDEIVSF